MANRSTVPDPEPVTVSEIADALELRASGRARVDQIIRRLGIEPVRVAGRTRLYGADTIARVRSVIASAAEGVSA